MKRRAAISLALKQHIPEAPRHPVLLDESERGTKIKKPENSRHSGKIPGIHPLRSLDTGMRRYDDDLAGLCDHLSGYAGQFLILLLTFIPLLCCRALEG